MSTSWLDLDITNTSLFPRVGTLINTTGGSGTGAVVFAIVTSGVITSLNIIFPGTGYLTNFSPTISGAGSGASVTLTVAGGGVTGYSSLVGGTGYSGTAPAWSLNFSGNFVSTLAASLASWRANVSANNNLLSNLNGLSFGNQAGYVQFAPQDLPGTTYTVSAASWSGGVVTLTLTGSSGITVGQLFSLAGVTPSGYNTGGPVAALSGTTGTTLKYALALSPGTYTSGGTVTVGTAPSSGAIAPDVNGVLNNFYSSAWHKLLAQGSQAWTAIPTPVNGWTSVSAAYYLDPLGFVHFRGQVTGGTSTPGTVLFTMPGGLRPITVGPDGPGVRSDNGSTAGAAGIRIATSGDVSLSFSAFTTTISLNGFNYAIF